MRKTICSLSGIIAFFAAFIVLTGCTSTDSSRSTGEYFDDQTINARVKAALLEDDDVKGMDISTTTFDGVVQLSGFVDSSAQKYRAERVAERTDGVDSVVNNITVNPRDTEFGGRDAQEEPTTSEPIDETSPPTRPNQNRAQEAEMDPDLDLETTEPGPRANDEDLRETPRRN